MRRSASILVLTVAALASVATNRAAPGAYLQAGPDVFLIDPADPEPVVVQLEGRWGDGARRRAQIMGGDVQLELGAGQELPVGVVARASVAGAEDLVSDGGELFGWLPATCDPVACTARIEIRFEIPEETEPFEIDVVAYAAVKVTEYRDEEDLDVELTLSGPGVP
jgi:hypothetical protein